MIDLTKDTHNTPPPDNRPLTVITECHDAPTKMIVLSAAYFMTQGVFTGALSGSNASYGHATFLGLDKGSTEFAAWMDALLENRPMEPPTIPVITTIFWRGDAPPDKIVRALDDIGFPWHKHGIDVTKIPTADLIKSIAKL